ncbi:alpha/beta fold hydrolase [Verticiella sediminum]|uniref:Alpha/beta fold hydrolase n=1 Tax=Verticiella sediminum TaxID=1247510 RepID=A0A556ARH8_9BURK|nr:alpha/beta fold hydrolase [Verticiella sediminum]TSH95544.1 alpha/beta fold hydrolase [Verticiella sediminum]
MSHRRILLLVLALLLTLAGASGYIALDRWQRATIFSVELGEQRWWREPVPGTEVFDLELDNGDRVRAWYLGQPDPGAPAVLYLHGARWNLNGSVFRMERWHEMGFAVLAVDYRGFGESTPRLPSQASAVEDARAGWEALKQRQPDPARRFIYGHSLGGAVAAQLASRAGMDDFAGLVLDATFTNIRDMLATTDWSRVPGLPLLITQPFDTLTAVGRVQRPLLVLHGTADRVIPEAMGTALHEAGPQAPPSRYVRIAGASHSGASRNPAYEEAVQDFVRQASEAYASQDGRPARAGQAS